MRDLERVCIFDARRRAFREVREWEERLPRPDPDFEERLEDGEVRVLLDSERGAWDFVERPLVGEVRRLEVKTREPEPRAGGTMPERRRSSWRENWRVLVLL